MLARQDTLDNSSLADLAADLSAALASSLAAAGLAPDSVVARVADSGAQRLVIEGNFPDNLGFLLTCRAVGHRVHGTRLRRDERNPAEDRRRRTNSRGRRSQRRRAVHADCGRHPPTAPSPSLPADTDGTLGPANVDREDLVQDIARALLPINAALPGQQRISIDVNASGQLVFTAQGGVIGFEIATETASGNTARTELGLVSTPGAAAGDGALALG